MTNDFPKMLYHADGRTSTVNGEAEQETARSVGFGTEPYAVHRQVQSFVPENILAKTPSQGSKPDDPFGLLTFVDLIVARTQVEVGPAIVGMIRQELVPLIVEQVMERLRTEFVDDAEEPVTDASAPADKPRRGRPPKDRTE